MGMIISPQLNSLNWLGAHRYWRLYKYLFDPYESRLKELGWQISPTWYVITKKLFQLLVQCFITEQYYTFSKTCFWLISNLESDWLKPHSCVYVFFLYMCKAMLFNYCLCFKNKDRLMFCIPFSKQILTLQYNRSLLTF